jgi:uncharacterized surface protein with fasciclin (FAS1) repeats
VTTIYTVLVEDAPMKFPNIARAATLGALVLAVTSAACSDSNEPELFNVAETAELSGFTTLATAVEAAGLTETLATGGPFTVFAPTNDAFAAIPAATLNALLADSAALTEVLLYHVVSGEVLAETVVTLDSAVTLQGSAVTITVDSTGGVMVNDAEVTTTDVTATNGVIHVIDEVLLPPQ